MEGMTFARAFRSEVVRLHHSPLVPLHGVIALVLGVGAGAYFAATPWNSLLATDAFFQLVGAGAPLLVGLSCGLAIDAECEAGDAANLLGVPARRVALAAKGAVLLALGLMAALCAALLFFALLSMANRDVPSLFVCAGAALGVAAGSVVLYAGMLWVALRFGRNVAIGVGALGFGLALMSLGGLANGLVTGTLSGTFGVGMTAFVPFAWPARFASLGIECAIAGPLATDAQVIDALSGALVQIGSVCGIVTVALVAVLLVRANRFELKHHKSE